MKIIFMDIDGVLNSVAYDRQRTADQGNIDETRLPLLKRIIDTTQACIVLTSSWRKHWVKDQNLCDDIGREINALFAAYGLPIYDKTPVLPENDRAEEVRLWLKEHNDTESFAILDDIAFGWGDDLQDHLVRTNCRVGRGLEDEHVQKAIAILS